MGSIYNVLVIGAGKIGAFFDTPESEDVLTHAHAFSKAEGFKIIGFVDLEKDKAEKAAQIWGGEAFTSIEEVFAKHRIDIVSVCVPDEKHFELLEKLSVYPIKLVFAEKPLTKTLQQAEQIIELYNKKNIKGLINYSRRFVSEFENLKSNISTSAYGGFICGNGFYGKGTLHNGSHLIDFLSYLLGEISLVKTLKVNYDFYFDDPSVSGILDFKNGGFFTMLNVPCQNFTIFELDLMFERARVKIKESGFKLELYKVCEDERFTGYKNLAINEEYNTSLGKAMENAVLNIYNYLNYNEKLKCTLEDAYAAMSICEKLKGGSCNE